MVERLIIIVQSHDCLFNMVHKDYSNNSKKERVWDNIRKELQLSGNIILSFIGKAILDMIEVGYLCDMFDKLM